MKYTDLVTYLKSLGVNDDDITIMNGNLLITSKFWTSQKLRMVLQSIFDDNDNFVLIDANTLLIKNVEDIPENSEISEIVEEKIKEDDVEDLGETPEETIDVIEDDEETDDESNEIDEELIKEIFDGKYNELEETDDGVITFYLNEKGIEDLEEIISALEELDAIYEIDEETLSISVVLDEDTLLENYEAILIENKILSSLNYITTKINEKLNKINKAINEKKLVKVDPYVFAPAEIADKVKKILSENATCKDKKSKITEEDINEFKENYNKLMNVTEEKIDESFKKIVEEKVKEIIENVEEVEMNTEEETEKKSNDEKTEKETEKDSLIESLLKDTEIDAEKINEEVQKVSKTSEASIISKLL